MHKTKHSFLAFFLTHCLLVANAQNNTFSPYSILGVGNIVDQNFVSNKLMGELSSIALDSSTYAFNNPASMSQLKGLTVFNAGASMGNLQLNYQGLSKEATTSGINNINIAFPLYKKIGLYSGLGLNPYSYVGYDIVNEGNVYDSINYSDRFIGRGGLTDLNWSLAANIAKDLSIGASASYIFGTIEAISNRVYDERVNVYSHFDENISQFSGIKLNTSVHYSKHISKKYSLIFAANYSPSFKLKTTEKRLVSTRRIINKKFSFSDTILFNNNTSSTKELPSSFNISMGIGNRAVWMLGIEYNQMNYSNLGQNTSSINFGKSNKISIGGYFSPYSKNENNLTSKGAKFFYRTLFYGGAWYENSHLTVNNERLSEFGTSFGLGIPMTRRIRKLNNETVTVTSRFNIGLQYINYGSANNINEQYWFLKIGLNLADIWFDKFKYQ